MWNEKKQARCNKLKKQRSKLYSQRSYLKKKLSSLKSDSKKSKALSSRIELLNSKIQSFRIKLFKCGKTFHKLVVAKNKLLNANAYLLKKLRKGGLSPKEKQEIRSKIGKNNDRIRELRALMDKDFVISEGKIETFSAEKFFQEKLPVWVVHEEVEDAIDSSKFSVFWLEDQSFSIPSEKVDALFALGDYVDYIQNTQHKRETKTPMLWVTFDEAEGVITVSLERI